MFGSSNKKILLLSGRHKLDSNNLKLVNSFANENKTVEFIFIAETSWKNEDMEMPENITFLDLNEMDKSIFLDSSIAIFMDFDKLELFDKFLHSNMYKFYFFDISFDQLEVLLEQKFYNDLFLENKKEKHFLILDEHFSKQLKKVIPNIKTDILSLRKVKNSKKQKDTTILTFIDEENYDCDFKELLKISKHLKETNEEFKIHAYGYDSDSTKYNVYLESTTNIVYHSIENIFEIPNIIASYNILIFLSSNHNIPLELRYALLSKANVISYEFSSEAASFIKRNEMGTIIENGNINKMVGAIINFKDENYQNEKLYSECIKNNSFGKIKFNNKKSIVILLTANNGNGGVEVMFSELCKIYEEKFNFIFIHPLVLPKNEPFIQKNTNAYVIKESEDNLDRLRYEVDNCISILIPTLASLTHSICPFKNIIHDNNNKIKALYLGDAKYLIEESIGKNPIYQKTLDLLYNDFYAIKNVAVLSPKSKIIFEEKFPTFKISTITNLISKYIPDRNNDRKNFAYIGRIESVDKNVEAVIDIAKKLPKDIKIDFYGPGSFAEQLKELIINSKLENQINVFGPVDNNEVISIMSQYKATLMFSKNEGLPNALLESFSSLTPVILFNSFVTASEIVENEKNGFLIEDFSSEDYANTIIKINDMEKEEYQTLQKNIEITFSKEKRQENLKVWEKFIGEFNEDIPTAKKGITIFGIDKGNTNSKNLENSIKKIDIDNEFIKTDYKNPLKFIKNAKHENIIFADVTSKLLITSEMFEHFLEIEADMGIYNIDVNDSLYNFERIKKNEIGYDINAKKFSFVDQYMKNKIFKKDILIEISNDIYKFDMEHQFFLIPYFIRKKIDKIFYSNEILLFDNTMISEINYIDTLFGWCLFLENCSYNSIPTYQKFVVSGKIYEKKSLENHYCRLMELLMIGGK